MKKGKEPLGEDSGGNGLTLSAHRDSYLAARGDRVTDAATAGSGRAQARPIRHHPPPQSNTITDRASSPRLSSSKAELISSSLMRREIIWSSFSLPPM